MKTALASVSLRTKLTGLAVLFSLGALCVGSFGAHTIHKLGEQTQALVGAAVVRVNAASAGATALIGMDRSRQQLIAADEPADIRAAGVASMRSASVLDEQLQRLSAAMGDHPDVAELLSTNEALKPARTEILQAAKRNDDAAAMARTRELSGLLRRVEDLSEKIETEQKALLATQLAEASSRARRSTYAMFGVIGVFAAIAFATTLILGHSVARSLAGLRSLVDQIGEGNLAVRVSPSGSDEVGSSLASLSGTVERLNGRVAEIRTRSTSLGERAHDSTEVASGIQAASADLQRILTDIQACEQSIRTSAQTSREHLSEAAHLAGTAADAAVRGSGEIATISDRMSSKARSASTALAALAKRSAEYAARLATLSASSVDTTDARGKARAAMDQAAALMQSQLATVEGLARKVDDLGALSHRAGEQADALHALSASLKQSSESMDVIVRRFRL